jgi:hypothetical protein
MIISDPVLVIVRGLQKTTDNVRCTVKQAGVNVALSVVRNDTRCKFAIRQMVRDVVDTQIDEA